MIDQLFPFFNLVSQLFHRHRMSLLRHSFRCYHSLILLHNGCLVNFLEPIDSVCIDVTTLLFRCDIHCIGSIDCLIVLVDNVETFEIPCIATFHVGMLLSKVSR